jgi:hypothetical protein
MDKIPNPKKAPKIGFSKPPHTGPYEFCRSQPQKSDVMLENKSVNGFTDFPESVNKRRD